MYEGDALALVGHGVQQRGPDQPLPEPAALTGFKPSPESSLIFQPKLFGEEGDELTGLLRALLQLVTGEHVLRILPEDHHVHELGAQDGGGHPRYERRA